MKFTIFFLWSTSSSSCRVHIFQAISIAGSSKFLTPTIPKFDGFYDHWAMLMENLFWSKEYWELIEHGVTVTPHEQRKHVDGSRLKDLKAKNYLFQVIDRTLETILTHDTTKEIWDSMRIKYQGSTKVKMAHLYALQRKFKVICMSVHDLQEVIIHLHRSLGFVAKFQSLFIRCSLHQIPEKNSMKSFMTKKIVELTKPYFISLL